MPTGAVSFEIQRQDHVNEQASLSHTCLLTSKVRYSHDILYICSEIPGVTGP